MKKYFYLFLMLPVLAFGQVQKQNHDYFVQFNMPQLDKKVNIDSILNHKALKGFSQESAKVKLNDFMSFVDKTKPVTIHGNYTDSIPYYQISLPLRNNKGLKQFIQNQIDQDKANDTIVETIKSFPKYELYSPKKNNYTLAWNNEHLVLYGLMDERKYDAYAVDSVAVIDSAAAVVDTAYAVIEETAPIVVDEPAVIEELKPITELEPANDEEEGESGEADLYNEDYYRNLEEENRRERERERLEKQAKQEVQLALLFDNGFTSPVSDKINTKADISAWVNYTSLMGKFNVLSYLYRYMPNVNSYNATHSIKGMNCDFYFENDKARMEQSIEYSEPLAKIVAKVIARKPNKTIFKYFPNEAPLAYMSYHVNTEEVLKSYPKLTEQALASLPMEQQDLEIITDLFSTIIDEKAAATIFDGDVSMFLHNMTPYTKNITETTYNEDYEEVLEEKTITKTKPIFSILLTSSHPTLVNKLLDLGVRKKGLEKVGNDYVITKTSEEFGPIVLLKDGDVFVITNGLNYLTNTTKSGFAVNTKKEIAKNYFVGNLDVSAFIRSLVKANPSEKDADKMMRFANQFKNLQVKSAKKLKENTMKLEAEFNATNNSKNIILQSLDLFSYLK
ncbi:hypothetical protein [Flavobacterium sp. GCM10027622]|uniref:hypothetical protein n=1 Tax=unclassified Flavobacterium TaxID=196869 RepID=UPI003616DD7D